MSGDRAPCEPVPEVLALANNKDLRTESLPPVASLCLFGKQVYKKFESTSNHEVLVIICLRK